MRKQIRTLLVGTSALLVLGSVPACVGGSSPEAVSPAASPVVQPFPQAARFIADMPMADGGTMTLGVAVSNKKVVAYACDGSKDEAWFFGSQDNGALDITGKFQDTLVAEYDGTDVVGDLTMNGVTYEFSAPQVADPAGMYTAAVDGVRASWVVRPGDTFTGVQFTPGDDNTARYKRQLEPADELELDGLTTTINGRPAMAELVTGDTDFR